MGLSVGIFGTVFEQPGLNFRDCFQTVPAEFSRLFSNSLDRIFGTVFGQSWTMLMVGFDPRTDVFGFYGVYWYHSNSVTNCDGTKRCSVFYGFEIWAFLCVIVKK